MFEVNPQTPNRGGGGARSLIASRPASHGEGTHHSTIHRAQRGFTLVELIVVIVILGILAAIAVPALTGYIAKSDDQKYIAQARNYMVACRSVLDEAYASGELGNSDTQAYIVNGTGTAKTYNLAILGGWAFNDPPSSTENWVFLDRIADLIAEEHPDVSYKNWLFKITLFGNPANAGLTMLNADGFLFEAYPQGSNAGDPAYYVSYRMTPVNMGNSDLTKDFWTEFSQYRTAGTLYDSGAGYEVYTLKVEW